MNVCVHTCIKWLLLQQVSLWTADLAFFNLVNECPYARCGGRVDEDVSLRHLLGRGRSWLFTDIKVRLVWYKDILP